MQGVVQGVIILVAAPRILAKIEYNFSRTAYHYSLYLIYLSRI